MPVMTLATVVSADEIADVLQWADEATTLAPDDEYIARKAGGTRAALDWVRGKTVLAPYSREEIEPTRQNIERESTLAADAERELIRETGRGTWPGSIHVALEFVLGRADSPF